MKTGFFFSLAIFRYRLGSLYSQSPIAREMAMAPLIRLKMTQDPAAWILFFSSSFDGLWSCDSSMISCFPLSNVLHNIALESPEFAQYTWSLVTRVTQAVHPTCQGRPLSLLSSRNSNCLDTLPLSSYALTSFTISTIDFYPAGRRSMLSISRKALSSAFG